MQNIEQNSGITMTVQQKQYSEHHQNNNYNKAHAAGRILLPADCDLIKDAYLDNISDTMTGAVARMIESAFQNGLSVEEIVMAIEETGFAPRPSPYYLKRILENWVETGVTVSRIRHISKVNRGLPWWK